MPKVIVLGGGVAGLSAAHELVERGFQVEVYEKRSTRYGGKARSMPDTVTGLPGEHGFRFFPGFYKHLPDTMSRIPFGNNSFVVDNLVPTTQIEMAQENGKQIITPAKATWSLDTLMQAIDNFIKTGLSVNETIFFMKKIYQIVTSCPQRRLAQYELIAWWDFIDANNQSPQYQKILGEGLTRSLVAMQAQVASTRTVGDILVQLMMDSANPDPSMQTDRVLNGPTNDVWLSPWIEYLQGRGVRMVLNSAVQDFQISGQEITGAVVNVGGNPTTVQGDYYVAAMPVERLTAIVAANPNLATASPSLARIQNLKTSWMNGIQFYLKTDVPLDNGHCIYLDSAWALTSISQHQFWPNTDLSKFDNGQVNGILSVDISDWFATGDQVVKKPAEQCTADEVAQETWAQLKAHVNQGSDVVLSDANLVGYHLDPDIRYPRNSAGNASDAEPLLINIANSWQYRPNATIEISNLFLASDYVRTNTDLATMEGANEAARAAVNAILTASGSNQPPCQIWPLTDPPSLQSERDDDLNRFNQGLPWDEPFPWFLKIMSE